jgi:transposase InsO family protein
MHHTTYFAPETVRGQLVNGYKSGRSVARLSREYRVSRNTVYRWLRRDGVQSRSSRPHYQPRLSPSAVHERVRQAREATRKGPNYLAFQLGMPASTVYKILKRMGINRLAPREQLPPAQRYEWPQPGDLVHIDVKKLGSKGLQPMPRSQRRRVSHECLHVMVDDHTRIAFAEIYANERASTATLFLERGLAWFASIGVNVQRVLTDNAASYTSMLWQDTCQLVGVRHRRTRIRRPQTNGKCERWNRTLMEEAIPGTSFSSLEARAAAIQNFVNRYNTCRPHSALGGLAPFTRLLKV